MKKSVALLLSAVMLVSLVSAVFAQNESEDAESTAGTATGFEKAYACLEDSVKQRGYSSLTSEEQAFAMLALAHDETIQGELRTALADSSNENRCWSKDGCKLKETALALIALNRIQQSTNLIENWLIEKTTAPGGLDWFLQIDADEKTGCTVSYGAGSKKITVEEDKKITGASGDCLSSALGGYWLKIDDDCYSKAFEVSCDKEFITALAYKKTAGTDTPYYISSITHSAPANSKTTETVNSLCFKEGSSSCNYEGSLWTALALKKMQKDVGAYLPYLIAFAPDYKSSLPSAFLFMLTGDDEYFTELINEQRIDGYWQTTSSQSARYYDTALGMLSLQGRSAEQAEAAKSWLLDNQPDSGCWGNIRDTSFILYAASPKNPKVSAQITYCEDSGYYCAPTEQDCEDALGETKPNYYCPGLGQTVCCTVQVSGELPDVEPGGTENECEERNYYCKSFCNEGTEKEVQYECSGIQSCCAPKTAEARSYWWIWLLVILIILLILAIIFRNQLKIWIFRIKSKFQKGPVISGTRPFFPPRPPADRGMRIMPRRILPGMAPGQIPIRRPMPGRPPAGHTRFPKEGALQETLKKLREMGR